MSLNVSVVVPVYNVEKYLDVCLESLTNQTLPFHEIILVDDGSKDSSGAICDKWETKNPLIKVVHQANSGQSVARNKGIELATGKYVLFVDSDDTIDWNTVERFEKAMGEREPDLCVGNLRIVTGENIRRRPHTLSNNQTMMDGKEYLKVEYAAHTMHVAPVLSLYKREFLLKNDLKFAPGLVHEDELFAPIVFSAARTVLPTDIEFYDHRIREGSTTTRKDKTKNAHSIIEICSLLEKWAVSIDDKILVDQILEHCVDLYYKVFVDADLVKWPDIRIDKAYLRKHGKTSKNRLRYMLYRLNERAFVFVEKKRRKMK